MNQIKTKWNKLDNAAKIFPAASSRAETHVFRFSCELDEPVAPAQLQTALEETARCFPIFGYVLHRGIFWYYLEASALTPVVEEEHKPLCAPLYRPPARTGLIRGTMQVRALLDAAHQAGVTMTVYLTACLISAIGEGMPVRARKKPVILNIPVNLRNYFASDSVRNFFTPIYVSYDFAHRDGTFADILAQVSTTFSRELDRDKLAARFNGYTAFEENFFARITPLHLKDIVLRAAYAASAKEYTGTLSNVGIVRMPDAFVPHIRGFHVCNATNKIQACVCSFGDRLSISITSSYADADIRRRVFRHLRELDPDLVIETNLLDDDA